MDRNLFPSPQVRSFDGFQLASVFKTAKIVKALEGVSVQESIAEAEFFPSG